MFGAIDLAASFSLGLMKVKFLFISEENRCRSNLEHIALSHPVPTASEVVAAFVGGDGAEHLHQGVSDRV